jgi:hypothetical protein
MVRRAGNKLFESLCGSDRSKTWYCFKACHFRKGMLIEVTRFSKAELASDEPNYYSLFVR